VVDVVAAGAGAVVPSSSSSPAGLGAVVGAVVGAAVAAARLAAAAAATARALGFATGAGFGGLATFALAAGAAATGAGTTTVLVTWTTQTFFSSLEPGAQRAKVTGSTVATAFGLTVVGAAAEADDETPP
jgi:hypothetical protein